VPRARGESNQLRFARRSSAHFRYLELRSRYTFMLLYLAIKSFNICVCKDGPFSSFDYWLSWLLRYSELVVIVALLVLFISLLSERQA
jgi:hypothetical protein